MAEERSPEEEALKLRALGIDINRSLAVQLGQVRALLDFLRQKEVEMERWAKSGLFVLDVAEDDVKIIVTGDRVFVVSKR